MMRGVRPGYRHVFVVMAVIVSLYFAVRTSHAVVADRALAVQLQDAQRAVDAIKQQNTDLSAELVYQSTPIYAEQVARQQLGLMNPGDHVIHVQVAALAQGVAAVPTSTPIAVPGPTVRPPNWQRWLTLLLHPTAFDAVPTSQTKP